MNESPLVTIQCTVYNHEQYLRQCLDGFIMQKTNFTFEAIVHDDASTDGSAKIIAEYAQKYPNIIKPIYQKENMYSKGSGVLSKILDSHSTGKYIALCEGDDYWIDCYKLQKQFDWLEQHKDYTMVWHDAIIYDYRNNNKTQYKRAEQDKTFETKDFILKGGAFIPTASMFFRKELYLSRPSETYNQFVGDYVYQIYFAIMGKVRYMSKPMCVYRAYVPGSWSTRHMENDINAENRILKGEHKLLEDLNRWSEFKYDKWFKMRFYKKLCSFYQKIGNYKKAKELYWKSVEINGIVPLFNCLREYRYLWRKQHNKI